MEQPPKKRKRAGKLVHGAISFHVAEKAKQIRRKYGPTIDYPTVLRILEDRESIRTPAQVRFGSDGLTPGQFGSIEPVSDRSADGYVISLHESFEERQDVLPALILYHAVQANYIGHSTPSDGEIFGAGILGMDLDDFRSLLAEAIASVDQA